MCLAEYEAGEVLRRLPPCGHEFHLACIDLWLTAHTTCPMCRRSLLPPGVRKPMHPTCAAGLTHGCDVSGPFLRPGLVPPAIHPSNLLTERSE